MDRTGEIFKHQLRWTDARSTCNYLWKCLKWQIDLLNLCRLCGVEQLSQDVADFRCVLLRVSAECRQLFDGKTANLQFKDWRRVSLRFLWSLPEHPRPHIDPAADLMRFPLTRERTWRTSRWTVLPASSPSPTRERHPRFLGIRVGAGKRKSKT